MALGDREDARLGLIEDLVDVSLALLVHIADDLRRLLDEAAQERLVPHDARMERDVRRGGHRVHQNAEVVEAPGRLQLPGVLELLGERDHVDDVASLEEADHGAIEAPVRLAVEHPLVEVLDGSRHRFAVDEHATQHRGLRFHGVRRCAVEDRLGEGSCCFHFGSCARYLRAVHDAAERLEIVPERPGPLRVPK